ncbi:MAG: DNA recombination protein RmuC [Candidatus Levybacteria bacterium]|nr:DNA recombination protein RmuC [Candidatus Levybacteria bacterium]
MENPLPIVILILLCFGVVIFFLSKKLSELKNSNENKTLLEWIKSMQTSLELTNKTLNETLHSSSNSMIKTLQENSKQLNERLDRAALVIKDVGKEVGQMSEIGRSMKDLQDFLKSPKLRGNIGEQVLKDLISQMFPKNSFFLQYQFKSGERVDAAIKTDAGILPIDSKFPMENFQRMLKCQTKNEDYYALQKDFTKDVKKHINSIAKKYVLPDEGTMDFALMYLPSESVYYELVNMVDVMEYAKKLRVYVVSPSTLYTHLQTILLSFEGKKIELRSKEIFKMLRSLQIDYIKIEENMAVLGKHINNASSQFANVNMGFAQIGQKINSTKNLEEIKQLPES